MYLDLITPAITAIAASSATAAYFQSVIKQHEICPVYKILTRTALEMRWKAIKHHPNLAIAFLDVDKLKQANTFYGQAECNRRLAAALSVLREHEKFEMSGRFYYGDEVAIIAPAGDIDKPINRVMAALRENGLSATIAVTRYKGEASLADAVKEANAIVENLKKQDIRGIVFNQMEQEQHAS